MFESGERQELNYMVLETRIAAKGFSGKKCARGLLRLTALGGSRLTLSCTVTEWILKLCVTLFPPRDLRVSYFLWDVCRVKYIQWIYPPLALICIHKLHDQTELLTLGWRFALGNLCWVIAKTHKMSDSCVCMSMCESTCLAEFTVH